MAQGATRRGDAGTSLTSTTTLAPAGGRRPLFSEELLRWHRAHPSYNSCETDRIEELIVNPVVLELAARRGNLDMEGIRYVVIRYGTQYQLLMPYREGHLSVGVEKQDDPLEIAPKIAAALRLQP